MLPLGVPADVRASGRQRLRECLRANLRKDHSPEPVGLVLERLLDLLVVHLSLRADDLHTVPGNPKQDDCRQRHIPSRSPPVVPHGRIIGNCQDPVLYHWNSIR